MGLDTFYFNLLNIKSSSKKEEEVYQIIRRIIQEEKQKVNNKNISSYEGLCKYFSYKIQERLNELGFMTTIQNTKDLFTEIKEHQYLICSYQNNQGNIENILIDPTYQQFLKKENEILLQPLQEWPSEVLKQTESGKEILEKLIKDNYLKIDETKMKYYLGSFLNETNIKNINYSLNIVEERLKKL